MIQIICCVCARILGYKLGGEGVSHSYCSGCYSAACEELGLDGEATGEPGIEFG